MHSAHDMDKRVRTYEFDTFMYNRYLEQSKCLDKLLRTQRIVFYCSPAVAFLITCSMFTLFSGLLLLAISAAIYGAGIMLSLRYDKLSFDSNQRIIDTWSAEDLELIRAFENKETNGTY